MPIVELNSKYNIHVARGKVTRWIRQSAEVMVGHILADTNQALLPNMRSMLLEGCTVTIIITPGDAAPPVTKDSTIHVPVIFDTVRFQPDD